jgi:dihydropteroate synthase
MAEERLAFDRNRPEIVGVLNVTPDSFSDGGRFVTTTRGAGVDVAGVLAAAKESIVGGATLLDVGGESTRPGAVSVSCEEELARTLPAVEALVEATSTPVSIDTRKAAVADAALEAGATVVNDVSGGHADADLLRVTAAHGAWLVLGHLRGTPETMQDAPHYEAVLEEVADELAASMALALAAGVARDRIVIDPGIGFGKRLEDNLSLIVGVRRLGEVLDRPIMLGPSRKAFLGTLTGDPPEARDTATHAACAIAAFLGVEALRVHDPAGASRAARVGVALGQAAREDAA